MIPKFYIASTVSVLYPVYDELLVKCFFIILPCVYIYYQFRRNRKWGWWAFPSRNFHLNIVEKGSLMAQWVKDLPAMQETQEMGVWSLGWEDPLEEEMATQSSILPWTEEPGWLQSLRSQRVRHDWAINTHTREVNIIINNIHFTCLVNMPLDQRHLFVDVINGTIQEYFEKLLIF